MKRNILLLRPDRAGDAIKTLPTLRILQRLLPDDSFHVLASRHNLSLFAYEKGVRVYSLHTNWEMVSEEELIVLLSSLAFPGPFDIAINLLCDSFPEVDRLVRLVPAHEKYSAHQNLSLPQNTPVHRSETENIALLAGQALKLDVVSKLGVIDWAPFIAGVDEDEARLQMGEKKGLWLGFCPFAGTVNRTHPEKRWQSFFSKATRVAVAEKYFLFGAKADRLRLQKIKEAALFPDKVEILFPSSFRTLGAYLKNVDGVVAVDSGPLHLAHALHIPSLGFLSGGDYRRWFPSLHEKDRLVKRGLFNRYPNRWEMLRAFRNWLPLTLARG